MWREEWGTLYIFCVVYVTGRANVYVCRALKEVHLLPSQEERKPTSDMMRARPGPVHPPETNRGGTRGLNAAIHDEFG